MYPVQYKRRIMLSLLCLLGLITLTGCASKSNRFGLVFISDDGVIGAADIYRIPDSTERKVEQLTFTPTIGEYYLLVSKKGDKIIFEASYTSLTEKPSESVIEERDHIYLLDTASKKLDDMTDIFTLPPTLTPMHVADWSPDQKHFAVITYETGLGIMDFDGANKKYISIPSLGEIPNIEGIEWSPDGKKLMLVRKDVRTDAQPSGFALLIYDLQNGELRQLTDYYAGCADATWSPTSQQVVAACANPYPYTDMVGPETIRILSTENPGQPYERLALSTCWDPSWSPDGKQIAFACEKGTDQDGLFIINSDGNGIHEMKLENLESSAFLRYPIWSPDGTRIIYVAGTDSQHTNIYSVNLDGSNNRPLTQQEASYHDLSVYSLP